MKPRTSYEREVVRLSRSLPGLSGRWKCRSQRELIDYANAITFRGRKTNVEHFIVVQRKGGWQVLRHWYMYAVFKYRRLDRVEYLECMQEWMKDGHYVFMALNRQQGYCNDAWCAGQDLSIKKGYGHCATLDDPRHLGYAATYYQSMTDTFRYLPTDDEAGVRVDWMMRAVNESSYWETVIKRDARLFAWMWKKGMADHREKAAAVKVALRYGQNVKDDDWVDLVDMLYYLGKDLHNPIYVAPRDFKKMHDEINRQADSKRRKEQEKAEELARIRRERYNLRMEERRAQKAKEKAEREKAAVLYYPVRRKKFFGMIIAGQGIEIRVLQSVSEFMEEGLAMHHCVFANEYYDVRKKPNCLILSAKKDGERLETLEVDMSDYKIVQCRGKYNHNTPYHDTIMKLMNDNMGMIKEINDKKRRVI